MFPRSGESPSVRRATRWWRLAAREVKPEGSLTRGWPIIDPIAVNPTIVTAKAPGRLTLIGEHTDYNQGCSLTVATDRAIWVRRRIGGDIITVTSSLFGGQARIPLGLAADPEAIAAIEPPWARLAAAVLAVLGPDVGSAIDVVSDLPADSGLSSSAAFAVALGLVFQPDLATAELAQLSQRAELLTGIDVGTLDPVAIAAAKADHALLIDFANDTTENIALPKPTMLWVVPSGETRQLGDSPYRERRAQCDEAAGVIGPLGRAHLEQLAQLDDPVLVRRARHVITECARVRAAVACCRKGDLVALGTIMNEGHDSLRHDFESSTPLVDALVSSLRARPGVLGARMVGGGFGGCVIALVDRPVDTAVFPGSFLVRPSAGAALGPPVTNA